MNDFQKKVASVAGGTSGIALTAVFGKEAATVGDHAPEFIFLNRKHVEETPRELLRQGALIASFFAGRW